MFDTEHELVGRRYKFKNLPHLERSGLAGREVEVVSKMQLIPSVMVRVVGEPTWREQAALLEYLEEVK